MILLTNHDIYIYIYVIETLNPPFKSHRNPIVIPNVARATGHHGPPGASCTQLTTAPSCIAMESKEA